ncbi:MAG: PKD domain-containing protein, partial [Saprospiraceae bacterium]
MNKPTILFLLIFSCFNNLIGQITYTANEVVVPYEGHFRAGSNFGLYPGFTDEMLGTLAAGNPAENIPGVGAKAVRPGLFAHFTYDWGYDIRIPAFQHYIDRGLEDNTVIVGFPPEVHRDRAEYCPGVRSEMFSNLYEPIWDNGENGTPVNDNNHYALYLYNVVTRYQDYVRFYEIWNEPGFDYTGAEGWLEPGQPGSWWDNDPNPCSYKLRAPIYHYIRTLRISWEIIKTLDPDGYIVVSGVGFPSFLDALLRNTDNPDQGNVSPDYPLKAGAYFDVLGMHSYPHFDGSLREWSNDIGWFEFFRHSDAAASGLVRRKNMMQEILDDYGYDGVTFPKKLSTITECNVPRREFQEFIGGNLEQRNFIMKAAVTCMQNEIHQLHVFQISERTRYEQAQNEFDVMGLYEQFNPGLGMNQVPTEEGIALRTTTSLLFGKRFDRVKTAALNLGDDVGGGAFTSDNGETTYVLWAKTKQDRNEYNTETYDFPNQLVTSDLQVRQWNYTEGFQESSINPTNIQLTSTPIFLIEKSIDVTFLSACTPGQVEFNDNNSNAVSWEWTFEGGNPASSNAQNPAVTYAEAGQYVTTLIARDAAGEIVTNRRTNVNINRAPQAAFTTNLLGSGATFSSSNDPLTEEYAWEFGDGATSNEASPNHTFARSGTYEVRLTVSNECGSTTAVQTVSVTTQTTSRLTYTANDSVPNFPRFRPGVNLNYYPGWTDEQLADIATGNPLTGINGAGLKTLRTQLPDEFISFWGYDIRRTTFDYYQNMGLQDNAVVVGFPSEANRSTANFCPTQTSALFKNMYLDIWDNGEFGTPINDENDYARYLYETVLRYRDQTTFWEIWNAPDLTVFGDVGWRESGEPGNWWDDDPDPCSYKLYAPIQHYVRMLRISYEIIKTYDPDAFVTISGIAFPAFLDALCRNTDNPQAGELTGDYPLRGGAYFDAVGYVAFPHLDGTVREYDHSIQTFRFKRNSDTAIKSIRNLKQQMEAVLEDYGYGANLPDKAFLISRSNVPRRPRGDYLGGDELQRNYLMKAYVEANKQNLLRFNVYQISETATPGTEESELQLMGLYENLANVPYYQQQLTAGGVGFKTTSDLLYNKTYDAARSAETDNYSVQAFRDADGFYTYMAWAKTQNDRSESANVLYSFPISYDIDRLERRKWDFGVNPNMEEINPNDVLLTGTPIFLTEVR